MAPFGNQQSREQTDIVSSEPAERRDQSNENHFWPEVYWRKNTSWKKRTRKGCGQLLMHPANNGSSLQIKHGAAERGTRNGARCEPLASSPSGRPPVSALPPGAMATRHPCYTLLTARVCRCVCVCARTSSITSSQGRR